MIKTTISSTPYSIRSSWNDVTFLGYCDIVQVADQPFIKRLSVYTGIPGETLEKLNYAAVLQLAEIVQFMDSPDDVTAFALNYESDIKIGHETYGKLESSKQAIKNAKIPLLGAVQVVKEYTGEDISDKPVTQSIGHAVFFLTVLESSWRDTPALMNMSQALTKWKQVQKSLQDLALMEPQPHTPVEIT